MTDNPLDAAVKCSCGHSDLVLVQFKRGFTVVCDYCGDIGPYADTPEAAVKAWNQEEGK